MSHTTLIHILKINELRKGVGKASGKPYEMQDCETMILDASGQVQQVGVLMLPKEMVGDKAPTPGRYFASFTLATDRERRIVSQLVGLQPVEASRAPAPSSQGTGAK